jgi:hypothetical protein
MCEEDQYCISYGRGRCCGCSCGCCGDHRHHHWHHEPGMGMRISLESPVPLMDITEEMKMLEEYKDALTKQLERVNKRLEGFKR